jgi:hypothetical protein
MMRRTHTVRNALVHALRSGATGTYDALATHAGLGPDQLASAQMTLWHLCREGKVAVSGADSSPRPGRPRAVYSLAAPAAAPALRWVLDRTLATAWR